MVFDTFRDSRNGYYFSFNPLGARRDALIENSATMNQDWDEIWMVKTRITEHGWQAEMAIPFTSLSFDPGQEVWGFNITRAIARRNERSRWANPSRVNESYTLTDAGEIHGLKGLHQGLGLSLQPYLAARIDRDYAAGDTDTFLKGGFDLFYKVTPAITAALTINTDFAETEVDDRVVNLTRFPVFFPEKRDFFLQDAGIFTFAGIKHSPLPYFSRRIGIGPQGESIDILGGLKVTGRMRRVNFGLLEVRLDGTDTTGPESVGVGRVSVNMFDESAAGLMFTHGDPRGGSNNWLLGTDFLYRNSRFNPEADGTLAASAWFQHTRTTGRDGPSGAFGTALDYLSDTWLAEFNYIRLEEDFNPALGFVTQKGIQQLEWSAGYNFFADTFNKFAWKVDGEYKTSLIHDDWEERDIGSSLEIVLHNGAEITVDVSREKEQVFEPFALIDRIHIPAGSYSANEFSLRFQSPGQHAISGDVLMDFQDFYNGTQKAYKGTVVWSPAARFNTSISCEYIAIDLPQGSFVVRVASAACNINFTPDLFCNLLAQWDSESGELAVNGRLRWTFKPGNDIFLVVNNQLDTSDRRHWRTMRADLNLKVNWILRF
jgi:hypothetical protein